MAARALDVGKEVVEIVGETPLELASAMRLVTASDVTNNLDTSIDGRQTSGVIVEERRTQLWLADNDFHGALKRASRVYRGEAAACPARTGIAPAQIVLPLQRRSMAQ